MHKYIPELRDQYAKGKITRREFVRYATLLGLSIPAAQAIAGCTQPAAPAAPTAAPAAPAAPAATAAPAVVRGGELRVAAPVQKFNDPTITAWYESNIFRHVAEYLSYTNHDGFTSPYLLEKWEPSEDLKTWTLFIRKGIKFNHGPELTADDVVWNFKRWLNKDLGSSMTGLIGEYLPAEGIERVDDYTVRLHLTKTQFAVPEHLFHNTACILSKDFEGDWMKTPVGTGPFTLQEYVPDERVVLKRREGYWQNGIDGQALPYLDAIRFVNLGTDQAPGVAALTGGQVDILWAPVLSSIQAVEKDPNVALTIQSSSQTHLFRMRADKKPFDDKRVRNAIKACQDRQKMLDATERGLGALAADFHVAPAQPEYCPMDIPKPDVAKAKALLAEAGYANGLDVELAVIDGEPHMTMAQLLKEQCEPAGIRVTIKPMPSAMYWEQWLDVDFGITSWTHRPVAPMTLSLAYRTGAKWNETHWDNPEFNKLLDEAEATVDVDKRREVMCKIETLMMEEGPVAIPRWRAMVHAHRKNVKNFRAAAPTYLLLHDVWMEKA